MLFQNPGYRFNDTVLHQRLRSQMSYDDLENFIAEVGEDVAVYLSTMTNDVGELPIDLCVQYSDIYERLLKLMMDKECIGIADKVQAVEPQSLTRTLLDRKLKRNIHRARTIATVIREMFTESSTHPQINYSSVADYTNVKSTIIRARFGYVRTSTTMDAAMSMFSSVCVSSFGNCGEFAHCAYVLMSRAYPLVPAEILRIKNGDHVFLVFDREKDSDLKQPSTWGNRAVICDPWAGMVYPVTEMNYYLSNYQAYKSQLLEHGVNVLPSYNPRYHNLCKVSYPADNVSVANNHATLFRQHEAKRATSSCNDMKDYHPAKRIRIKKN